MWRTRLPAGLLFAALLLMQCGCPAPRSQTYPDDPLFLSKKPLEPPPPPAAAATPGLPSSTGPQLPPVPAVVRLAIAAKE